MKIRYKFIHFEEKQIFGGMKYYKCINNRAKDTLGTVDWDEAWRQWVFCPEKDTIYSVSCMADISHFIGQLK